MNVARLLAALAVVAGLAACSFQNKYEREADRITHAVIDDDLRPIEKDIAPNTKITRVQVAAWSDELRDQGKYVSIKERKECDPGWHCFDAKFEKQNYLERMRLDDQGKVAVWTFHAAPVTAQ